MAPVTLPVSARPSRREAPTVGGMSSEDLLQRITIDPNICFGKPTIRGTRIWVGLVLDLLAGGMTIDELVADYPPLTVEDIRACLAYGAKLSTGRYVDVA